MKVLIDRERCEGNARCVSAAPAVFELGDDDQARIRMEHAEETLRPAVERAVRLCPRQAISIVDEGPPERAELD